MPKKSDQINVKNVPPEVLKQAQKRAIDEGKSLSEILREMLANWAKGGNTQLSK